MPRHGLEPDYASAVWPLLDDLIVLRHRRGLMGVGHAQSLSYQAMARPEGVEPPTRCFEGSRSIL